MMGAEAEEMGSVRNFILKFIVFQANAIPIATLLFLTYLHSIKTVISLLCLQYIQFLTKYILRETILSLYSV